MWAGVENCCRFLILYTQFLSFSENLGGSPPNFSPKDTNCVYKIGHELIGAATGWNNWGPVFWAEGNLREKIQSASRFEFFRVESMAGVWLGYGWGMARPKVTSAKNFKALRALNLFALKVLPGHGWGIAGVWLGPSPTNFSTPCPLGGIRVYEPPHI